MSKASAFLKPAFEPRTEEVAISSRFLDGDGNPATFRIKTITQEENEALAKRASSAGRGGAQTVDRKKYGRLLIAACVEEPDFASKELCDAYGTTDPLDVPGRMLLAGEYARLTDRILELNEFKEFGELLEEAKN
ncbi:MAG: phage portal protein [Clostridiales bacterium]|jgi:hypothetical protein|nr:phage portal protein [Clostridiales bacterium]